MKNLFGEIVFDEHELANQIIENYDKYSRFVVHPTKGKKTAFKLTPDLMCHNPSDESLIKKQGIYFVYGPNLGDKKFYIGKADGTSTIRTRLGRFIKEVKALSRSDEGHSGANKWRHWYGRNNFEGMMVVPVPVDWRGMNLDAEKTETYLNNYYKPIAHRDYSL